MEQNTDSPSPPPAGASCPMGGCGARSWMLLLIVLAFVGFYFYNQRSVPASFTWTHDLDKGLAAAKEIGKPVFVDFHATWCGACKSMDREVFSREDVARALSDMVPVKVDVDQQEKVATRYKITLLPTLAILNAEGEILARHEGPLDANAFLQFLKSASKTAAYLYDEKSEQSIQ